MSVIGKFLDDLFVARHFECMGLLPHKRTGQIIADNRISVREALAAGGVALDSHAL